MAGEPQANRDSNALAWWIAGPVAASPALIVAWILKLAELENPAVFSGLLAWAIAAGAASGLLEGWNAITRRFDILTLPSALSIGAIFGAVAALIGALLANDNFTAGVNAIGALAGSVQGALVSWAVARPDIDFRSTVGDDDTPVAHMAADRDAPPNPPTPPS